jgi:AcrR family transcriptional regulator/catechol 2,3-dioxygenase-like lactoylglutathione lyase family enzyme
MSTGRPRATSRDVIAEAACELFLEQGYSDTTVADITARAGVSRSSFFNYFTSKSDVLWAGLDERIGALHARLSQDASSDASAEVSAALRELGDGFAPDSLALALVHTVAMGLGDELEREAGLRRSRIAAAVAGRLRSSGTDALEAEVAGAAHAGAVLGAIGSWALAGAGQTPLAPLLGRALAAAAPTLPDPLRSGPVRQLRLVVHAVDFPRALTFYRDALGMPEQESYAGEGGAQVAILHAGRATLELSNAAQVELIDRVETDGDAPSDRLRVALEVADAGASAERLVDAGAVLEASARETPWRSRNARLRAPADLQVTLFQELDAP